MVSIATTFGRHSSRMSSPPCNASVSNCSQEEEKASKSNVIDFLNLVFGVGPEFDPFWEIVSKKVKERYDFEMKDPQDYTHGYLLKTVLYHCGIEIQLHDRLKLFQVNKPFTEDDKVRFLTKSKVYDFPSMTIHQIADAS